MNRTIALLLLLGSVGTSAAAFGQAARSKPSFSGTWVFDAKKSTLKVPPPSSMTLQIEQNDPQIHFSRTQMYGVQKFDWKLDAVPGDPNAVVDKTPDYTTSSRVYWQGSSLVVDQKIIAGDGSTVNELVTYTLADDGKTLQGVEHQATVGGKGGVTNKWVYDKKTD